VATEGPEAAYLLGGGLEGPGSRSTLCLSFAAARPPVSEPLLVLDGDGAGPVNHLAVMSEVADTYAPAGQALVSANVVGLPTASDAHVEAQARAQLRGWFGAQVDDWRLLRAERIVHALPALASLEPPERPLKLQDGLFVTGDWRRNGSINGSMLAGRHAAEAVLADLGTGTAARG
jgi:hypothetical protein